MRKLWLAALLVVIALPVLTQASVINFGGTALCGDTCAGNQVPDGYGDPNFTYGGAWYAYGNVPYDSSYANTYGAPSGAFAYNAFGDSPITISSSVPFTFNGVYASTWAENNQFQSFSSTTLEIQGFSGATLEGTVFANLSSTSFDFVSANFGHTVTSLVFTNDCGYLLRALVPDRRHHLQSGRRNDSRAGNDDHIRFRTVDCSRRYSSSLPCLKWTTSQKGGANGSAFFLGSNFPPASQIHPTTIEKSTASADNLQALHQPPRSYSTNYPVACIPRTGRVMHSITIDVGFVDLFLGGVANARSGYWWCGIHRKRSRRPPAACGTRSNRTGQSQQRPEAGGSAEG